MSTLFRYELRRLIRNKFFIVMLIIIGVYALTVLTGETILGTANTAPYSGWSFGAYLSSIMPMAALTVLLLLSGFYSKKEKRVEILLEVTPIKNSSRALLRVGAITVCFAIICAVTFGMAVWFYISVFGHFATSILPSVLVILPCYAVTLGFGLNAGRIHPAALYALMILLFVAGSLNLGSFDFFGGGYFANYPLTLPVGANGEPPFEVGSMFIAARLLYAAAGGILLITGIRAKRRIRGRA